MADHHGPRATPRQGISQRQPLAENARMRFVFHFEVLPRRRRDLPPGAGPPVSNSPATTACPPSDTIGAAVPQYRSAGGGGQAALMNISHQWPRRTTVSRKGATICTRVNATNKQRQRGAMWGSPTGKSRCRQVVAERLVRGRTAPPRKKRYFTLRRRGLTRQVFIPLAARNRPERPECKQSSQRATR